MNIKYKILGVHETETSVDLQLADGRQVTAKVPCFVVDAISIDNTMAHSFKVPADPGFHEGDIVEVSFTVTEAAPLTLTEPAPADPTV